MGQHKNNPRAQLAALPRPAMPADAQIYGFGFETVIELNALKMAEIKAKVDEAEKMGDDPRRALHDLAMAINPKDNPEHFDYVIYNRPSVGRPSRLLPDPRQIPTAQIRYSEHLRIPLADLNRRADEAFKAAQDNSPEAVRH